MSTNPDAYAVLRDAVMSFELLPGERLSERGLEPRIGASRTPIRAALVRLENEGLTRRDGRGWQVAPIDLTEVRAVYSWPAIARQIVGEYERAVRDYRAPAPSWTFDDTVDPCRFRTAPHLL